MTALFLARASRTWILARLLVTVMLAMSGMPSGGGVLRLAPGAAVLMVGLTTALGLVDVARRRERAYLGNLGVSRARLIAWLAAPAAVGETALALLLAAVR